MKRRNIDGLFIALAALAVTGCSNNSMPQWPAGDLATAQARAIVERSVEAHGGDLFAEVADLNVAFDGRWGRVAPLLQPKLADKKYRRSSEERYLLGSETIAQIHQGPAGSKVVVRRPEGVEVFYDGQSVGDDEDARATSALVADAYLMMVTAPSWFLRPQVELRALPPVTEDGRTLQRVQARFRPGFGRAEEDRALLWIDGETFLVHRVQFSIDGFRRTQGAEVDVTFSEHREIGGRMWPTLFVERIREPVAAFAHRWRLIGLDTDRGLTPEDLEPPELSPEARAPAEGL